MNPLADIDVLRRRLGVTGSDELADVLRLLDAVSDEVRRMTGRAFEGSATAYTRILRTDGTCTVVVLPAVPVASITSIARAGFDGTYDAAWPTTDWRLEDAERGRVELGHRAEFVRVVWTATGEVPAGVAQAAEDWVADRWAARPVPFGQTGYRTGEDAETWSADHVGRPSPDVARALALVAHRPGGIV